MQIVACYILVLYVPELMQLRIGERMLDRFSWHGGAVWCTGLLQGPTHRQHRYTVGQNSYWGLFLNRKNRTLDFLVWVLKKWWCLAKTLTLLQKYSHRKWYFPSPSWSILTEISFSFEIIVSRKCTLTFEYLREFSKTSKLPWCFFGAWGRLFMKKSWSKKSRDTVPLTSVCTSGKWNTDGCTYVPDLFLNFEACVMHDLCYISPGATKVGMCVFIWLFKNNTIPWDLA